MLAALAVALCQTSPLAAQNRGVVVRDSAGVHLVENVTPVWIAAAARRLNPVPTLTLGSTSWPVKERFGRVRSAVRLSDGSIVVADREKNEIRVFDSAGGFVRRIGRRGHETGQFFEVSAVFRLPGDSFLVWDPFLRRLTTFTRDRTGIETVNVDQPDRMVGGKVMGSTLFLRGPVMGGEMLAFEFTATPDRRNGVYVDSINVSRFSYVGQLVRITSLAAYESYIYRSSKSRDVAAGLQPLTAIASIAPGARSLLYTDGVHYKVREYDLEGKLLRIIRVRRMPSPVSDQGIAAFRDHGLEQLRPKASPANAPGRESQAFRAAFLRWVPFPKTLPAFTALVTEKNGNFWTREYGDTMAAQHWNDFDRSGRLLGVVEFPARIDVLEIGADYVLGAFRDTDSLETVRLYQFAK